MNKKKIKLLSILIPILFLVLLFAGCVKPTTYMVEMRDGTHLATDVYIKKGQSQPHGALLIRTTYNKNSALTKLIGMTNAQNGWPTVIQDTRGRYASEGIDTVFRTDHIDGQDTLSWIGNQTWSNKKIATYGASALGITQYCMAGTNPNYLACQYIQVASPNLHKHAMFPGGQFLKALVQGWLQGQGSTYILPELYANENYTIGYWGNVSLEDKWDHVNVPAIHIGGWYDVFSQGTIDGFMGYNYLGGSGAQGKSKLIMGPWTHGGAGSTKQGELTYPGNCKDTFSTDLFWEMVNQYTMNQTTGYDAYSPVTYYVMGDVTDPDSPGNEWRYADTWPVPSTDTPFYFHENGVLTTDLPADYTPLSYTYDPMNPVPTLGGPNLNLDAGPYDQRSVENRSDVLVFTSPVLTEPFEATGNIKAKLFVSSNCPDTDFTVKLTDVYPDGRSMLILDGILRMRNRNGVDHWELMTPGEIYEVEVDLWSTSYIWNTGHQIRVAISSSNYPRFLNNPNTADGIYKNSTYSTATNTLYIDSLHPSGIILPAVSVQAMSTAPQTPHVIDAESVEKSRARYRFSITADDPDSSTLYLYMDWGDGATSGWVGPYSSGSIISLDHWWQKTGIYDVRIKARDSTNAQSPWSQPLKIHTVHDLKTWVTDKVQNIIHE